MTSPKLLGAAFLALVASTLSNAAPTSGQRNLEKRLALGFKYGEDKVRGVNIGGWLVLEPWITPSLFEKTGNEQIVDEWTFGELQDRNTAQQALQAHWDSWITEDDFKQIAAAGLNHVRIPIGYWAYETSAGEPYIPGQVPYLDKAIGWAEKYGLKVVVDLHGAPGSQNGFDNSGRRGDATFMNDQNNAVRAKNVLNTIAKKYADSNVVSSIQLLNEPLAFNEQLDFVKQFYRDAYGATRFPQGTAQESNYLIMYSDAFQVNAWQNDMKEPDFKATALDAHHYQVFDNALVAKNWDQHIGDICGIGSQYSGVNGWLIVGEWSLASTDCAKYLNGRGIGSRYEGSYDGSQRVGSCSDKTGSGDNFSAEYKEFMRKFYDAQVQTYENSGEGWFYWCWKNEDAADWSYQRGLELGYIPRNPAEHKYAIDTLC